MTKLGLNQGDGSSLMRNGLPYSIGSHSTLKNWQKTHFLSFSEDRARAEHFMMRMANTKEESKEHLQWNAHIISFDQRCFTSVTTRATGVYSGTWTSPQTLPSPGVVDPSLTGGPMRHEVLIVDVVTYMYGAGLGSKAPFAAEEKEWVVLPMDPMTGPHSNGEMKAQISHTFIDQADFFVLA